jgi:hypothetical protein
MSGLHREGKIFKDAQAHAKRDLTSSSGGSAHAHAHQSVSADKLLGGVTHDVGYDVAVACNEPRLDGDLGGIIDYFWGGTSAEVAGKAENGKQSAKK